MQTVVLEKPALSELYRVIENQKGGTSCIFRGQGNADWGLVPSLYRLNTVTLNGEVNERAFNHYESRIIDRFYNEGVMYLGNSQRSYAVDRITAQHFGVPTRLLDWSSDPLVATYFAIESFDSCHDSAVFLVLPEAIYRHQDIYNLNSKEVSEAFGPHIVNAMLPPAIDRRIPAQKSIFTFHPYGNPDGLFTPINERDNVGNRVFYDGGSERVFAKIIIPQEMKIHLLRLLLERGVDRRNLFPGLDGVGSDISMRMRIGIGL